MYLLEHLPELDVHVVVLLLHPVDLCTDALKTFPWFVNSEYFYLIIGAERNFMHNSRIYGFEETHRTHFSTG